LQGGGYQSKNINYQLILQLSIINYQLSIINYQLSIINYQLSIINYQLSIINYQLSIINLSIINYQNRINNQLSIINRRLIKNISCLFFNDLRRSINISGKGNFHARVSAILRVRMNNIIPAAIVHGDLPWRRRNVSHICRGFPADKILSLRCSAVSRINSADFLLNPELLLIFSGHTLCFRKIPGCFQIYPIEYQEFHSICQKHSGIPASKSGEYKCITRNFQKIHCAFPKFHGQNKLSLTAFSENPRKCRGFTGCLRG
jgi:hypothetical protein